MKTIIEMAREANEYADAKWALWPGGIRWKEVRDERLVELVRAEAQAEEREECAKVCESYLSESPHSWGGTTMAAAIRARGNT
jgi:hypothetical protein